MYNEIRKKQFIEDYSSTNMSTSLNLSPKLNKVSSYEEKLDKDLCEFTVSEILDYYKILCTPSLEYLMTMNSWFSIYTRWCLSQSLVPDCQNHYNEIDNLMLIQCINSGLTNKRIITREELLTQIKTLDNPSDQFLCIALFEGISGQGYEELYNASIDQINGNEMTLSSGRVITISDELKRIAEESANEYKYYCFIHSDIGRTNERLLDETDTHIIKRTNNSDKEPTESAKLQRIINRMTRIYRFFGSECFKCRALRDSGTISFINDLYHNGNYEDIVDCIKKNDELIANKHGKIIAINRFIMKYNDFLG